METFVNPLKGLAEYEEIRRNVRDNRGILQVTGCLESQKALVIWSFGSIQKLSGSSRG